MDFSRLLGDAWALTWRFKVLWLLGLFTGGSAGACGSGVGQGFNDPRDAFDDADVRWSEVRTDGTDWLGDNLAVVLAIASVALALIVLLVALNTVASGGIARATSELAQGRRIGARGAWAAGLRLFWRYLALVVLNSIVGLILLALAGVTLLTFGVRGVTLAGLALLVLTFPYTVILTFAQCSIAVRDDGPIEALSSAIELFRLRLSQSLLAWLIHLAVVLGVMVIVVVGFTLLVLILLLIGLVAGAVAGSVAVIVYAVVIGFVVLAAILAIVGIVGAFTWSYWMLAYLRLSGMQTTID